MKQVDEIFYDALLADESLMTLIGGKGRVTSTCFEVPPDMDDQTPLPNIIITDNGFTNNESTKDTLWEGSEDIVQVGVDVAGRSTNEVKTIIRKVRLAIGRHIASLYNDGEETPELESLTSDGVAWDWMKPCYYQKLIYQCIINNTEDDEQEN